MNPIIDSEASYALSVFLLSCLLGGVLSVFYNLFKILRIAVKFSAVTIAVQDFVFWFLSGLAVFMFALWQNDGIVRGYVLAGALIGALVYNLTIGALIARSAAAIVGFFQRVSEKIKNGVRVRAANAKKKFEAERQKRKAAKIRLKQDKAHEKLNKKPEQPKKNRKIAKTA